MRLNGLNIVVLGAGIGGLAAARAFAQRGADVTVLEQAPAMSEVGAGLQVSPNGAVVLRALGLGEELDTASVRGRAVSLRDHRRGEVLRLDLGEAEHHFLHRADLIGILAAGARAAGARIRLLQKAERVVPGARPAIHMSNGARVEADLVIGADGLHSVARQALDGTIAPFFTQQVAWRALVPNSEGRDAEVHLHMGPMRHVVSYPLRGRKLLNVVAVQERAAWTAESWSQQDDPLALRAAFEDFGPEVRRILERVEQVNLWGLFRHPVATHWQGEGVALMGDAAHPTLPFMAQGACMALEDAWVLATSLDADGALDDQLAAYQARREDRVRRVVAAASRNAWKYHLSVPPLRWAAHAALRLGGAVAPARMMRQFDWIYAHDVTGTTG